MPKYKEEQESRYTARTVAILAELPEFCTVFYDKNQTTFLPKTQYDYMRAMRTFLTYLQQSQPYFYNHELANYTLDDLNHLTVKDANEFIVWLQQTMSVSSVKTRISCISSIFTFFAKSGQLMGNPFLFANRPVKDGNAHNEIKNTTKEHSVNITEKGEKHNFTKKNVDTDINTNINVNTNRNQTLSAKKKQFDDQYGLRDEIIFQILKETEIRISELAELNIQDFDLRNQRFYVYRTKQRSTWITMSETLTDLIERYLEERSAYSFEKDTEAMFLVTIGSYRGSRLGIRSIERIVSTIRKRQL
ncbi:tyrosine-type recombinase/integrase [uncultured Eubacterium sp.]|uniref:tyrosine-type recombinase/integrase n=1 Tax=uncultured Eubacterium sp. TaxID=165185 RepID=UPI0025F21737|nr:tyrosine-type recombinase/integrase [uncultured Eubacterium sp.]